MIDSKRRLAIIGLALVLGAATLAALPAAGRWQQVAHAQQIRTRCVHALDAKRSWKARIVQTETGSDGKCGVTSEEVLVRRPGSYRLTLSETDEKGRPVVSTSIRTEGELYTRRVNADGSSVLHVVKGIRPSVGIELDNSLGQAVQAVSEAPQLTVAGQGVRGGRVADKLQLEPGQFVWVDRESGMPIEQQAGSAEFVADDVVFSDVQANVPAPDSEFDPSALGGADSTVVEDLGFRNASAARATAAIGFSPLSVPVPNGFSLDQQGYVDSKVPNGDAPTVPSFVSAFSNGLDGVVVTQVLRPGLGDSVPAAATEGPDAPASITVGGKPAIYYEDAFRRQLVFARGDILVTVEGSMSESAMEELAGSIRQ